MADDSRKVHFTGPGGPPQLPLSPNEGRETCCQVSAGQHAEPYKQIGKAMACRSQNPSVSAPTIHNAWEVLASPDIDKYIATMPERVQAVLDASGSHTRF